MDKSSLIDFDNENCFKIPSPLIPAPANVGPRLSILENNPFDTVLKKISNKDDPFEIAPQTPIKNKVRFSSENKENIGHLISPIQTPRIERFKKLPQNPLRINDIPTASQDHNDISLNCTDTSLQILSDSFINDDLSNSFMVACKLPLPSSSDEEVIKTEIPSICIKDNDSNSNNTLNNGFIDNKLSLSGSSFGTNSFNGSIGSIEISAKQSNPLENVKCSNINNVKKSDKLKINNSFGGFNVNDRRLTFCKETNVKFDDSVFFEAAKITELLHKSAITLIDEDNIANMTPPWLDENIIFDVVDDDNDYNEEKINKCTNDKKECIKTEVESEVEKEQECNQDVKNAKDLLNNLTAIINNSGNAKVDKRQIGESIINSLALALNIETPLENRNKLQRSKSDSRVADKRKSLENEKRKSETKLFPKLKTHQPVPPVDKNIKVKKDKITAKGPLKAFIPITNMAKTNKVLNPKQNSIHTTPTKHAFLIKKTSTPNEPKMKAPIAQSTPDISKLNTTPNKRQFGFPLSPLSRPASTNDINMGYLNNSLSPKSNSNTNLNKSNSKLPTIYTPRRNSASDMSTSRSKTSLNKSYDNSEPAKPSVQLKRSSSFQNKTSTGLQKKTDNNNTVKKYGMPGTLKSLKLVPKK